MCISAAAVNHLSTSFELQRTAFEMTFYSEPLNRTARNFVSYVTEWTSFWMRPLVAVSVSNGRCYDICNRIKF